MNFNIRSTGHAEDAGYLALAAVEKAARGMEYRIIGGHMVRTLQKVYPVHGEAARLTVDADAAVETVEVAGRLRQQLLKSGFRSIGSNSFEAENSVSVGTRLSVDVLVPTSGPRPRRMTVVDADGRQWDGIPAINQALARSPVVAVLKVEPYDPQVSVFSVTVPVPPVDVAVTLKAFAVAGRHTDKDLQDLLSLMEIRDYHSDAEWRLGQPELVSYGRDAAAVLHQLAENVTVRGGMKTSKLPQTMQIRLAELIRVHVTDSRPR